MDEKPTEPEDLDLSVPPKIIHVFTKSDKMLQNNKLSLNYEIIGKLTDLGFIEHKIFLSCKP